MSDVTYDQTLALAGVCQSCYYVQSIARRGQLDSAKLEIMLNSVLNTNPNDTQDVYSGIENLADGLKILHDQLGHKAQVKDAELTRYVLSILTLERKLTKSRGALNRLAQEITLMDSKLAHYDVLHDVLLEGFAGIYKDVVSPLGPKVQVMGNPNLLQQRLVQNKVRALLLSALRSAVLWRQLGGQRRNILFRRQKWVRYSAHALQQISTI
ncbi:high frequency lysogenization protein HflD [Catenovulum sediminis]|uniref:High frequency lysogenization protein HflD homolog n=1 Tax=Catenovulum sediminis TaxID=1740262 RepID=A0ABV1RDZ0_9ALTE|nr:high frequency lysogenization protein HflD [Catenovulum sediminis]